MAAIAGAGSYTFAAFALSAANFWIHVLSTIYTVLRKKGSFVVTPKKGAEARQPGAVMPALVAVGILVAACIYGLIKNPDAATINNVSFAAVHISILMTGCWAALQKPRAPAAGSFVPAEVRGLSRPDARRSGRLRRRWRWAGPRLLFLTRLRRVRVVSSASPSPSPPGSGCRRPPGASSTATSTPTGASSGATRAATRLARARPTAMLMAAAIGDAQPLQFGLGLDKDQPPPSRRADLVPMAQRACAWTPRRRPTPISTPAGRCSSPPAASSRPALRQEATQLGNAIMQVEVASSKGHAGADRRSLGDHSAGHGEPQLLLACHVRGAPAPPPATAAGALWRRARARSPTR